MAFVTENDLREDALWLAGEPITSVSDWYTKVVDYLDYVLKTLVTGGTVGAVPIEGEDYAWALKFPRQSLRLLPAFNAAAAYTVTLTKDSTTVGFDSMPASQSLLNYYVVASSAVAEGAFIGRITAHTTGTTSATMAATFPYTTVTSTDVKVIPVDYTLPTDFLRFFSPLYPITGDRNSEVQIIGASALETAYPLVDISEGMPEFAGLIGYTAAYVPQIRISHYPSQITDVEYDYIRIPTTITGGSVAPEIPVQHRRLLSLGAAYLIALDKQNDRAPALMDQFIAAHTALTEEHKSQYTRGAKGTAGRIFPRGSEFRHRELLRDSTGRIIAW